MLAARAPAPARPSHLRGRSPVALRAPAAITRRAPASIAWSNATGRLSSATTRRSVGSSGCGRRSPGMDVMQQLPEFLARALDSHPHRRLFGPREAGDLLVFHPFDVTQQECLAIERPESLEGPADFLAPGEGLAHVAPGRQVVGQHGHMVVTPQAALQ